MSNIVRLSSGDTIQIRTGVLQGIGPSGPTGGAGPAGVQGEVGPQGPPGPTGAIADTYTKATGVGTPQSIATVTETLVSFGTVVHDDGSLAASTTNFAIPIGVHLVRAQVLFTKPSSTNAAGHRRVSIYYDGVEVDKVSHNAVPTYDTAFSVTALIAAVSAGKILTVKVFHSDTVSISTVGTITLNRIGAGAVGDDGPVGPDGAIGPTGPTGPIGPAGTLIANTTTIANIGG